MDKEFAAHSGQAAELARDQGVRQQVSLKDLEDRYRYDSLLERVDVDPSPGSMSQKPQLLRFDSEITSMNQKSMIARSKSPTKSGIVSNPLNKENLASRPPGSSLQKQPSKLELSRDAAKKSPQRGASLSRVSQKSHVEDTQDLSERKNTIKSRMLSKLDDL